MDLTVDPFTKPERPPLRATCWPKGTTPVLGQCGRITYIYGEHGRLKAAVFLPAKGETHYRLVDSLDWCHALANDTRPGGKNLPPRPKDFRERYCNTPKGWTHAQA